MPSEVLDGFIDLEEFARQVKRGPWTVRRWTNARPDGLPYIQLGRRRLIHIDTARQWLMDRMVKRASRRSRIR
jgi:hypothetical protein